MDTAKLLELSQSAARKFTAPILGPVQSQDKEDMQQEAALAIWGTHTRKPEKPNSYLHQVGYYAAGQWWRRFVLCIKDNGQKAHNRRRFLPSLDEPIDHGGDKRKRTLADVTPAPQQREESSDALLVLLGGERFMQVWNWLIAFSEFFPTRHKRQRAMVILALLLRGYNTSAIALELSLSEYTVRQYRREIQAALAARLARQGGQNGHR